MWHIICEKRTKETSINWENRGEDLLEAMKEKVIILLL
jgi:hypothetical protein